jgi:hypothetical protein
MYQPYPSLEGGHARRCRQARARAGHERGREAALAHGQRRRRRTLHAAAVAHLGRSHGGAPMWRRRGRCLAWHDEDVRHTAHGELPSRTSRGTSLCGRWPWSGSVARLHHSTARRTRMSLKCAGMVDTQYAGSAVPRANWKICGQQRHRGTRLRSHGQATLHCSTGEVCLVPLRPALHISCCLLVLRPGRHSPNAGAALTWMRPISLRVRSSTLSRSAGTERTAASKRLCGRGRTGQSPLLFRRPSPCPGSRPVLSLYRNWLLKSDEKRRLDRWIDGKPAFLFLPG